MYQHPHQFEPLLPTHGIDLLMRIARGICEVSDRLSEELDAKQRQRRVLTVRASNAIASNAIEGLEAAAPPLPKRAGDPPRKLSEPELRYRAHLHAEWRLEGAFPEHPLSRETLMRAHRALTCSLAECELLPAESFRTAGRLRERDVSVARHVAPAWNAVPAFLRRADEVYCQDRSPESSLVAAAAAHHRQAWVHPFEDGNGRAVRLQATLALRPVSRGLWSPVPTLAKRVEEYRMHLANADMPRHGDLDGRGNLSDRMLSQWCQFYLEACLHEAERAECDARRNSRAMP